MIATNEFFKDLSKKTSCDDIINWKLLMKRKMKSSESDIESKVLSRNKQIHSDEPHMCTARHIYQRLNNFLLKKIVTELNTTRKNFYIMWMI